MWDMTVGNQVFECEMRGDAGGGCVTESWRKPRHMAAGWRVEGGGGGAAARRDVMLCPLQNHESWAAVQPGCDREVVRVQKDVCTVDA